MARPPLPVLLSTARLRPVPKCLPFSFRDAASPRPRTRLPHFSSSNASSVAINSPGRPSQPEDFTKTPLEKSIDALKRVKARARDSFARMNQTHEQFELDLDEASRIVSVLESDQRCLADMYAGLLDFSARQIQRCFRGHTGRRLFRQAMVVRSVLRIQRRFRELRRQREETRKMSRVMYRKVLRGLRGVRERHELSHAELLTRVGHNLQVEAQWRKAMGVKDTESDLITALYRKKYVRRKLGAVFRHLYWLHSIGVYWKALVPQPAPVTPLQDQESELADNSLVDDWALNIEKLNGADVRGGSSGEQQTIVIIAPRRPNATGRKFRGSNRDELRLRQRATMREIQQKKDDEIRKEEEAVQRLIQDRRNVAVDSARGGQSQHAITRRAGHKSTSNLRGKQS
ncbi:hypothetical protein PRNP1_012396 [Phytophthora ramorum]